MWYIAGSFVLLVTAAGLFTGIARQKGDAPDKTEPANGFIGAAAVSGLSIDQINILLARLESEGPPETVFGAMCYGPMAMPDSAEYICPVCGEKTLYGSNQASFILWELQGARRLAESLDASTAFSVILDESSFCDFCSGGGIDSPAMLLRVTDGPGTGTENRVTVDDLRKLNSFLQGNLYWVTSNDSQQPLRAHGARIAQLLGIPAAPE